MFIIFATRLERARTEAPRRANTSEKRSLSPPAASRKERKRDTEPYEVRKREVHEDNPPLDDMHPEVGVHEYQQHARKERV